MECNLPYNRFQAIIQSTLLGLYYEYLQRCVRLRTDPMSLAGFAGRAGYREELDFLDWLCESAVTLTAE